VRIDPRAHHELPPIDPRVDRAGVRYFDRTLNYEYANKKYVGYLDTALRHIKERLPAARGAVVDGAIRGLDLHPEHTRFVRLVLEMGDAAPGLVKNWLAAHPNAKQRETAELMAVLVGAKDPQALHLIFNWLRQNYQSSAAGRWGQSFDAEAIAFAHEAIQRTGLEGDRAIRHLLTDEHWALQTLGVRILASNDPGALAETLNGLLDSGRFDGARESATPEPGWLTDRALEEALEQLRPASTNRSVRAFWLRLLSSPSKSIRVEAVKTLREELDVNEFVTGLFEFIVAKTRFSQQEVDIYIEALKSFEGINQAITTTLSAYIAQADGKSDRIFWLLKVLSIYVLHERGDVSSIPLLETLARDPGRFFVITTAWSSQTNEEKVERQEKTYKKESNLAIAAIRSRS
jgi:hypothetical protein